MTEPLSVSAQKEVPKHKEALQEKYNQEPKEKEITLESTKLPKPTGWRLLVLPFKMKETTKGGIVLAETTLEKQQVASQVGLVMAIDRDWETFYNVIRYKNTTFSRF